MTRQTVFVPCPKCKDEEPAELVETQARCRCGATFEPSIEQKPLKEKYVQKVALKWLELKYRNMSEFHAVASAEEVSMKKKIVGRRWRADGLVVGRRKDGNLFTASLEAKSFKTRSDLQSWCDLDKSAQHAGLAIVLLTSLFTIVFWLLGGWVATLILSPLFFFVTGFVLVRWFDNLPRYQVINAIDQVLLYKANEYWIAFSSDVYDHLPCENRETLFRKCKNKEIGIIVVCAGKPLKAKKTPCRHKYDGKSKLGYLEKYVVRNKEQLQKLINL